MIADTIAPALDWRIERFSPENLARMRAHPRFADALRRSTQGAVEEYERDPKPSNALKDLGRFFSGMLCLYLHSTEGGLTLTRLRTHCAESDFISPAAAESLLAYMRDIGFIEPAAEQPDRRSLRLVPTGLLRESFLQRYRIELEACVLLDPKIRPLLDAWDEPGILEALFRRHVPDLLMVAEVYDHSMPSLEVIFSRNAGALVLYRLLTTGPPDERVPPTRPLPLSASALARKFGVSRTHVTRLVEAGEEAGLFIRTADGRHILTKPLLAEMLEDFFAKVYTEMIIAARATLDDLAKAGRRLG